MTQLSDKIVARLQSEMQCPISPARVTAIHNFWRAAEWAVSGWSTTRSLTAASR